MPSRHTPLRLAIFHSGQKQFVIAKKAKLAESRLSVLANGRDTPKTAEAERIAKVLRLSVQELFPDTFTSEAAS